MTENTNDELVDSIELFPFFRLFFSRDDVAWNKLSPKAKTSHSYMLIQFLSIMYPVEMQTYNTTKTQLNSHVIDALHNALKTRDYPGWMYTRVKHVPSTSDVLKKYDPNVVETFVNAHQIEYKSLHLLLDTHYDVVTQELDQLNKIYLQNIKKKKR